MTAEPPHSAADSLQAALLLVERELGAASIAGDVAAVQSHAQNATNVLVGPYGRWYAGDAGIEQGVLPGERVPGPAPDVGNPQWPAGWALLVYGEGRPGDQAVVRDLIGDVGVWQSAPRRGYDAVAAAIAAGPVVESVKLAGPVGRTLAYARLILATADSLERAHRWANLAAIEAGQAARIAGMLGR
ncbi:MAG: hypothetical protein HZB53_13315 [Chloroflexi bacterium]|nr:hypothetical protein [Chloroflexota bacterium]